MKKDAYLETYELTLTTKSPLFIGSGQSYTKKEYVYVPNKKKVHIIDANKLFQWIIRKNLINSYESFILKNTMSYLYGFLHEYHIKDTELQEMTLYQSDVSDIISEANTLNEINGFMRGVDQLPYVPGSSIKGALRTILLTKMLLDDASAGNNYQEIINRKEVMKELEVKYFHKLKAMTKTENAVNSIMRGISVSDSLPLQHKDMVVVGKNDVTVHGKRKSLNLTRECVKVGVDIRTSLAIDKNLAGQIDFNFLQDAIKSFGSYYKKTYNDKFKKPDNDVREDFNGCIVLGGGSGYFSKNIAYPLLGEKVALVKVSEMFARIFKNHHHDKDVAIGISPHCLKHTLCRGKSYHFGVCKVTLK